MVDRANPPRSARVLVVGLAATLLLTLAGGVRAEPSIRSKEQQAEAILAQIRELEAAVGFAAERFNGANYRLQQVSASLSANRRELSRSRKQSAVAQRRLQARIVELYVNGGPSPLGAILAADSLGEAIEIVEAGERIAEQDRGIAEQAKSYRNRLAARERTLTRARIRQALLVRQRAAEREAIEERLAERERLLGSVREEIERLEARERARQAELERRARAELERQRRAAAARALQERARSAEAPAAEPSAPEGETPSDTAPQSTPAPPADSGRGAQVVAIAMQYLGVPYKWGGASPSTGFDCSGFTMYVFAQIGVSLPHYAAAQFGMGSPVSRDELAPGDLVFFRGLGHMGMYIGGGNFIHSPQTGDVVKISSLSEPSRIANWVGARRVL